MIRLLRICTPDKLVDNILFLDLTLEKKKRGVRPDFFLFSRPFPVCKSYPDLNLVCDKEFESLHACFPSNLGFQDEYCPYTTYFHSED